MSRTRQVPRTSWARTTRHPRAIPRAWAAAVASRRWSISRSRTTAQEGLVGRREQQRVPQRGQGGRSPQQLERLRRRLAQVEPGVDHHPLGRDARRPGPAGTFGAGTRRRRPPGRCRRARGRGPAGPGGCGWPRRWPRQLAADLEVLGVGEAADVVAEHGAGPVRLARPPRPARCPPTRAGRSGRRRPSTAGISRSSSSSSLTSGPGRP